MCEKYEYAEHDDRIILVEVCRSGGFYVSVSMDTGGSSPFVFKSVGVSLSKRTVLTVPEKFVENQFTSDRPEDLLRYCYAMSLAGCALSREFLGPEFGANSP